MRDRKSQSLTQNCSRGFSWSRETRHQNRKAERLKVDLILGFTWQRLKQLHLRERHEVNDQQRCRVGVSYPLPAMAEEDWK